MAISKAQRAVLGGSLAFCNKHNRQRTRNGTCRGCYQAEYQKNWGILNYELKQQYKVRTRSRTGNAYKNIKNANNRARMAKQKKAMPKWANKDAIKQFYINCPKGHHVDHIVPLRGRNVSGLHILGNLQYLPASENLKKSNKF